jgi:hypothetical protein
MEIGFAIAAHLQRQDLNNKDKIQTKRRKDVTP